MISYFNKNKKIFGIVILDGWGIAPAWGGNAISRGRTKTFDTISRKFPSTTLLASGDAVGLPTNAPGNSEAGHLNIGAGRVIRQDISLIDKKIEDGSFFQNQVLLDSIEHAKKCGSHIHLMGMLSKTGVHAHIRHLYALLNFYKKNNFEDVYIHLFTDGRDSDPMAGIEYISEVEKKIKEIGVGKIISIMGRFFAMDRDNRWGRIARAYNLLVKGEGNIYSSPMKAISSAYSAGQTDEFIEPRLIGNKLQHPVVISNNDSVILFNFRSDRTKELVKAFLGEKVDNFPDRKNLKNLFFASFVVYEDKNRSHHVFTPEQVSDPIAKVWSESGVKQLHIAETEKYPHVTYFINGGVEKPFSGEKRVCVPSPRNVKTYDLKPEMSAAKVADVAVQNIKRRNFDSFILNFANADMVGHSGNFKSTVRAIECVDECLRRVLDTALKADGTVMVLADHGNAEQMVNPRTGQPDTEHTTNPVPFIVVSNEDKYKNLKFRSDGILASVAPTVLEIMELKASPEMVNQSLIIKTNLNE